MATLNIDDPEAHRLATLIARQTGESVTRVVTEALRERFERLPPQQNKATVAELRAVAARIAALSQDASRDHAGLLYDERGLPK